YPLRYVRSEQHSQRACGPQPGGARRRAGICGVAAPRRCHHIACVAAPCICPPGARAKMHTLFSDGPLAVKAFTTKTRRSAKNFLDLSSTFRRALAFLWTGPDDGRVLTTV